jgi:molecular chaperone GrpE (heat shock protein)
MTTPNEKLSLPDLLKVPEISDTLDLLAIALKDQQTKLDEAQDSLAEKVLKIKGLENSTTSQVASSPETTIDEFREPFAKAMAEVSVALWRIKQSTDKLEENKETRRIQRDLLNCIEALKTLGLETIDRSNADLNTGMYRDMEVISNETTSEVTKVTVSEVLKPAVHFRVQHALLRKAKERADQPPFIIQKCQIVTKSPPLPNA